MKAVAFPQIPKSMNSPWRIQEFLDEAAYNSSGETRSPRIVLEMKRAHCMEGALFAAACLEKAGYQPLILDMLAEDDDDHVIALFQYKGFWGAVAKSNFTTLRYREPVYRSLRELVMSYFDFYFNTLGVKSLRSYSRPVNLIKFDSLNWRTTEDDLECIGNSLNHIHHYPLISPAQLKRLEVVGNYLLEASLIGSNPEGLFVPGSAKKV
jgi:hypothetical protein